MIYYITRQDGSSIQFGGLERIHIWHKRPILFIHESCTDLYNNYKYYEKSRGYGKFNQYLMMIGEWYIKGDRSRYMTSFNKIFGYGDGDDIFDNSIANAVWNEIEKEFNYADFQDWNKIDQEGKSVWGVNKFMLKLTINQKGFQLENISEDSEDSKYDVDGGLPF